MIFKIRWKSLDSSVEKPKKNPIKKNTKTQKIEKTLYKIYKKLVKIEGNFILCLFWYAKQQNPYNLLTNKGFCFGFYHIAVLVLLAKQQQQKIVNLYMISVCYAWALSKFPKKNIKKFI
jgi:hypothetical protein